MEFRLTYEGRLLGASKKHARAEHKHEIRKVFHNQLKRQWDNHRFLRHETDPHTGKSLRETLAGQFHHNGYEFVPIVNTRYDLLCSLDILMLRPDPPGAVVQSGDLDNRLKTLLDALRMPSNQAELAGYEPSEGEHPFFVLMEDDQLVDRLAVESDTLLEPTGSSEVVQTNDVRVVVSVKIKPYFVGITSIGFV